MILFPESIRADLERMIELWDRVHPYLEDLTAARGTPGEQADLQMLAPLLSQISLYPTRMLRPTDATEQPPPQSRTALRPAVLIVEDEPDLAILLHRLVRDYCGDDFEIVVCINAEDALAHAMLRLVVLVITDYRMPGSIDGLTLTRSLKELSPSPLVTLITAYPGPQLERKAREAGADYYFPKPFGMREIEAVLRRVQRRWKL